MLPITLWTESGYRDAERTSNTMLGLQYGIFIALIFYNLILFFTIRESSYLYYVLCMSTQALFVFLDTKHLRFLLNSFTDPGWLVDTMERLVYPLLILTTLLFQRKLLRVDEFNPNLDRLVRFGVVGVALVVVLALLPNEKYFQYFFIFTILLAFPLSFYINIDAIRRGDETAVVHMAAISVFLFGAFNLILLQLLPGYPNNSITNNAYDAGLIVQALLLSVSLSFRYNQIKQEKADAQALAITNLIKSEQIKDDLLANVSHELRTPLYGINGLAESAAMELRAAKPNQELVVRNLELIQASGDRLTKLVNDLLEFSRAEEEATYVKFKPVDLNSLVTLVLAICKPLLGDKDIDLRSDIDPDLPLVAGDEDRLQQILVNLTTNAIKFTYSGEVVISAHLTDDYNVTVSVRDTGIGIHKTDQATIFKTFEKLPTQMSSSSGIGLGLPLAKRMVEMHRSELSVDSDLDVGSTFSFNLRVSIDQTRAIKSPQVHKQMIRRADYLESANAPDPVPKLRSEQETTIIIVDDDEINRVVMGQQLEEFNVIKCANGYEALQKVDEEKPDLILLDLMMPGLNGYEVCQKLRQKFSPIELPVILVTAKNHLEDLTQGFETGANDYLAKPFHYEELRSRVDNQLRLTLLHKVNEDNIKLRSQIETYASAETELRNSRMRLQQILESVQIGFIAFELPGTVFSLNSRGAELLGANREAVLGMQVQDLLTESANNGSFKALLDSWDMGDTSDHDVTTNPDSTMTLEFQPPGGKSGEPGSTILKCQVKIFGEDEGTGILFLEQGEAVQSANEEKTVLDAVELVSFLGQAQQNVRRIASRLSVLTPQEVASHPQLVERLSDIDALAEFIDGQLPDLDSEGEYRQQLVTLMRSALHTWEVTTQKSKIELAEESNIWAVSIDDGRLRTRTFDRYLRTEQLPKIPRWREVIRTAYFVLSDPSIEPDLRASLEAELERTKAVLKKAAIN